VSAVRRAVVLCIAALPQTRKAESVTVRAFVGIESMTSAVTLLKQTYTEWTNDKGPRLGAALAYYAIFSIPPLMMIALAVLGLVYSGDIMGRLQTQLAALVGADTARTLLTGVEMKGLKGGLIAGLIGIGVL